MNITELLPLLEKNNKDLLSAVAIGLDQKSHIFLSLLIKLVKERNLSVQLLEIHDDFESNLNGLQVSFLGMSLIYVLDTRHLDEKKKSFIINYAKNYKGPHFLIILVDQIVNNLTFIELFRCTLIEYNQLFLLFYPSHMRKNNNYLRERVFQQVTNLSLDTACILMQYQIVLGNNITQFINEWIEEIVMPDRSLFTLSSYFFAKNSVLFWKYWDHIKYDYPDVFWTSFWSEQLFRSHGYLVYNKKKSNETKNISYRLPFSFIQKDYKKYTLPELAKAHNFLYQNDFHIKNGSSNPLELFFLQFLLNKFQ